ncbi:hypothetical protein [Herbidospora cretacea]|uniref:hypothetical protein n=1 Tax=Herbidospora cretacea TaxID=28444 RepID=UPI0009EDAB3A
MTGQQGAIAEAGHLREKFLPELVGDHSGLASHDLRPQPCASMEARSLLRRHVCQCCTASPHVLTTEEMAVHLREALRVVPADRLWVNPDCGLKTRGYPETRAALANMVAAARTVRATP